MHSFNIFFFVKSFSFLGLLKVYIICFFKRKISIDKYLTIVFTKTIMTSTQELVITTNVAIISTISVKSIPPSPYVVHGEKPKKHNVLNFKR